LMELCKKTKTGLKRMKPHGRLTMYAIFGRLLKIDDMCTEIEKETEPKKHNYSDM